MPVASGRYGLSPGTSSAAQRHPDGLVEHQRDPVERDRAEPEQGEEAVHVGRPRPP